MKTFIIGTIIILICLLFIIPGILLFILLHPLRFSPKSNPKEKLGFDYEDIEFNSCGNKIKGWGIFQENARFTMIYSHGFYENRESRILPGYEMMKEITNMNGNFICYDFSGTGKSEGNYETIGFREKEDVKNAVEFAKTHSNTPVILYGVSMGAVSSLLAAAESENVSGAFVDSPFSDLKNYLEINLPVWTKLPRFPFNNIIIGIAKKFTIIELEKVSPVNALNNIDIPIFIAHGKGDNKIPYTETLKIIEKNSNNKNIEYKIFNSKGHCQNMAQNREDYINLLKNFIETKIVEN